MCDARAVGRGRAKGGGKDLVFIFIGQIHDLRLGLVVLKVIAGAVGFGNIFFFF